MRVHHGGVGARGGVGALRGDLLGNRFALGLGSGELGILLTTGGVQVQFLDKEGEQQEVHHGHDDAEHKHHGPIGLLNTKHEVRYDDVDDAAQVDANRYTR